MNIALRQLQVFVSVAQEGSITQAAEKLFLTKPAVSMALSELEKQLNHALFDRHKNRLILNHQGKQLLPLAAELLERAGSIASLFEEGRQLAGQLAIGCSDTVGNQVLPFLLQDFREKTQHSEQSVLISNTRDIADKLLDFEIDIGLVEGRVQRPSLQSTPWLGDEMVVVCSPHHPLAKRKTVTLLDLEQTQWLLREPGSGTREFFLNQIAARLADWKLAFELNTTEALINSCAAGLGMSCLSQRAVQHAIADGRLTALNLPLDLRRDYYLVYHQQKYQSPLLQAFVAFCQQWQDKKV
ncbi:LysR family transcriptional regulator [Thaumasiovibrio subtropicus]|uniref:LysR family transcriptional regulator n=1 Tax=Thaumasiovibrio subtropicus TaxID=1891207 RepID=UPI000B363500|nr:LysR family transcriptional regulator [Thaumasiovibrio subtropicus]